MIAFGPLGVRPKIPYLILLSLSESPTTMMTRVVHTIPVQMPERWSQSHTNTSHPPRARRIMMPKMITGTGSKGTG